MEQALSRNPNDPEILHSLLFSLQQEVPRWQSDPRSAQWATRLAKTPGAQGDLGRSVLETLAEQETCNQLEALLAKKDFTQTARSLAGLDPARVAASERLSSLQFQALSEIQPATAQGLAYQAATRLQAKWPRNSASEEARHYTEMVDQGFGSPQSALKAFWSIGQKLQDGRELQPYCTHSFSYQFFLPMAMRKTQLKVVSLKHNGSNKARAQIELKIPGRVVRTQAHLVAHRGIWTVDAEATQLGQILSCLQEPKYPLARNGVQGLVGTTGVFYRPDPQKLRAILQTRLGSPDSTENIYTTPEPRRSESTVFGYSRLGIRYQQTFAYQGEQLLESELRHLVCTNPSFRTRQGLGVGNSLADWRRAYPLDKDRGHLILADFLPKEKAVGGLAKKMVSFNIPGELELQIVQEDLARVSKTTKGWLELGTGNVYVGLSRPEMGDQAEVVCLMFF